MADEQVSTRQDTEDPTLVWHTTACVLCSNNCGVEVRLEGRSITRVRGNKAHLASTGYTCEKAGGTTELTDVAANELTTTGWVGPIAKTPWHKHVPARLEIVSH